MKQAMIMIRIITLAALLTLSPAGSAATLRVPAEYPTIQAGIDAASDGDMVLVADGTYTGDGNRDIDFLGKAITVRSENGPEACIIDCEGGVFEQHRGFIFVSGETGTSILQELTIKNGNVAWFGENGGGIHCVGSSPTITGNVFTDCEAGQGGGVYCQDGSPAIINNTFSANRAYHPNIPGASGNGAAIVVLSGSEPYIAGNTFNECMASARGGAIYSVESSPQISGNEFSGNHVTPDSPDLHGYGGSLYCLDQALVENNQIEDGLADQGGGIYAEGSVIIRGNFLDNNYASWSGGGIKAYASVQVLDNIILRSDSNNIWEGAGIHISGAGAIASGNVIADTIGTAIASNGGPVIVENSLLVNNAIAIWSLDEIIIRSCTIVGNQGITAATISLYGDTTISDTIIWDNTPDDHLIKVDSATLTIANTNLEGGSASIELTDGATLDWGPGMIDADPLFVAGVDGEHYLSQAAAGQAVTSPCVDTGSASASDLGLDQLTTRTDLVPDSGVADMGYHYPATGTAPETTIISGPDGTTDSPVVCFSFTGIDDEDPPTSLDFSHRLDSGPWSDYSAETDTCYDLTEYGSHTFEVRSRDTEGNLDPTPAARVFATIPWDNSGWTGLVTGPGPGPLNPPLVRTPLAQWTAYDVYRNGVNVAAGDVDGDGTAEVITGPGPGPSFGPHVRCREQDGTPISGADFLAYGTLKYGVNVAAGDLDGDGFDEIVTGAGPGAVFGPHVRGWNFDNSGSVTTLPGISFFAYGTLKYGVNVACGDIDGDGFDEIVTGAGPGAVFGPHVRAWNWDGSGAVEPIQDVSYFAYGTPKWGVNVACGDLDGDGIDEIITGPGPGASFGAHVRAWNFASGTVTQMPGVSFFAYASTFGCVVGAGDLDGDNIDEILTMPGPGPELGAHLRAWNADGGTVSPVTGLDFYAYDQWFTHGGRVAGTVMAGGRKPASAPVVSTQPAP